MTGGFQGILVSVSADELFSLFGQENYEHLSSLLSPRYLSHSLLRSPLACCHLDPLPGLLFCGLQCPLEALWRGILQVFRIWDASDLCPNTFKNTLVPLNPWLVSSALIPALLNLSRHVSTWPTQSPTSGWALE